MATIVIKQTREDKIRDMQLKKMYFCPYCRVLFEDLVYTTQGKQCELIGYQCPECNKCFSSYTYSEVLTKGMRYKLPKGFEGEKEVDEIIKDHIFKLHNQNYTHREIHTITNFSRSMVQKLTVLYNGESEEDPINKKKFCKIYLRISNQDYDKIIDSPHLITDIHIHSIRKALKWGCSFRQISSLLKVSTRMIGKAKDGDYSFQKIFSPLTQNLTLIQQKRIDHNEFEIRKQTDLREKPFEKDAVQNGKIKINDKDQVIIIRSPDNIIS